MGEDSNIVAVDFNPPTVSQEGLAPSAGAEALETRVYKRQARTIIADWLQKPEKQVRVREDAGRCYVDFPDPENSSVIAMVSEVSWWLVLRRIQADLIRLGFLDDPSVPENSFWCNSHQRYATHRNEAGEPRCNPRLGGILLPCSCVQLVPRPSE